MKKFLIIVVTTLCLLAIIIIGVIYFLSDTTLLNDLVTSKVKEYICLIKRGSYECSYGWGKRCYCVNRYKDGGKSCTNSSQCSSNKCLLKSSQLEQLGYNIYPNSNITNAAGKYENCSLKEIDKLPDHLDQIGECQTFRFNMLTWGCIGVLNDGNVKFECGCAVQ